MRKAFFHIVDIVIQNLLVRFEYIFCENSLVEIEPIVWSATHLKETV